MFLQALPPPPPSSDPHWLSGQVAQDCSRPAQATSESGGATPILPSMLEHAGGCPWPEKDAGQYAFTRWWSTMTPTISLAVSTSSSSMGISKASPPPLGI